MYIWVSILRMGQLHDIVEFYCTTTMILQSQADWYTKLCSMVFYRELGATEKEGQVEEHQESQESQQPEQTETQPTEDQS